MPFLLRRRMPGGPTLLMLGVTLGLAWPALAASARPLMPGMIFLIVLGTLLRIDTSALRAAIRRPAISLLLPILVMLACPVLLGIGAGWSRMPGDLTLALVLVASAPPSSGTAAVARLLGLDGTVPLLVTGSNLQDGWRC